MKEFANLFLGTVSDTLGPGGMTCNTVIVVGDRVCSRRGSLLLLDKF